MITLDETRALALSLPEARSEDHHGMESFRVCGRIFATVPDVEHLRVMTLEEQTESAVAEFPQACAPFWWGRRLACVVVTLATADPDMVRELLTDAWRRKAPKRLEKQRDAPPEPGPATGRQGRGDPVGPPWSPLP